MGGTAFAGDDQASVLLDLQHRWATANYQVPENDREEALKALVPAAEEAVRKYPQSAALLAWRGIILSTYAGAKGGLGALDLAKQALNSLEAAAKIDENAIGGGIDTSIGALYYRVPGWPLGFGDDDKAAQYLSRGLELNPTGIDENYFYADFLIEQGEKDKAALYLQKALDAAPRPDRADADTGRHKDIAIAMAKLAD
jgi:tetratricopeptide (TPR) repeat protein